MITDSVSTGRSQVISAAVTMVTVAVLLFTACDNTLDPIDREKGLYSLYGSLDIDRDTNYVRIRELNSTITEDSTREIDATVRLRNMETGESEVLRDSVVRFEDVFTHNFYTDMEISENTDYELTIKRSDGKSARALASTPNIADVNIEPTGENCYVPIEITFEPIRDDEELNVSIGFEVGDETYWTSIIKRHTEDRVRLRFTPKQILDQVFFPGADFFESQILTEKCCFQLSSDQFHVKFRHFGPNYLKGTSDTLAIRGGTGRFGGLYDRTYSFKIDTSKVRKNPPCQRSD